MNYQYVLTLSTPALLILVALEIIFYKVFPDESTGGYSLRDTATNMSVGIGSVITDAVYKFVALAMFTAIYELTPLRMPLTWWSILAALLTQDFCYYWMHREHHVVRVLWAAHVVHHSSEKFNLSISMRQPWTGLTSQFFYIPLVVAGVPPWMIFLSGSIIMLYQFWVHTERIGRLPRPVEFLLNTASNHRVHHGSQGGYLDRNFGGILMIWDRMFGTYADETERPVYGLTKNIDTHNPFKVATHEYAAIGRDLRRAHGWSERLRVLTDRPGWFAEQQVHREQAAHTTSSVGRNLET